MAGIMRVFLVDWSSYFNKKNSQPIINFRNDKINPFPHENWYRLISLICQGRPNQKRTIKKELGLVTELPFGIQTCRPFLFGKRVIRSSTD